LNHSEGGVPQNRLPEQARWGKWRVFSNRGKFSVCARVLCVSAVLRIVSANRSAAACRIRLGGEGNVLYPVFCTYHCYCVVSSLMLMAVYNVSINLRGFKYLRSKSNLVTQLAWIIQSIYITVLFCTVSQLQCEP